MSRTMVSRAVLAMVLVSVLASFFVPMEADAKINYGADITYGVQVKNSLVPIDFSPLYVDSSDVLSHSLVGVYRGSFTVPFYLSPRNGDIFYSGSVSRHFNLNPASFSSVFVIQNGGVSISSSDLPEGVSCSIAFGDVGTPKSFDFILSLDNVRLKDTVWFYVTFDVFIYGYFASASVSSLDTVASMQMSVSTDWSGNLVASDNIYDLSGLSPFYDALVSINDSIISQVKDVIVHVDTDSSNQIAAANQNSQAQISAANQNSANEIAAANKNADDIMHSYDSSSQEADNQRFEDARKELQEQEDSLFSSAMEGFGKLDMSEYSFGRFTAMASAFSFVSGFLQSLYVKMGDFGAIVTIGLVIMIASKVIGLYRFSTGGDSS